MAIVDRARQAFEKYYDSRMAVKVNQTVADGPFTQQKWVEVVSEEPCRISQKQLSPASDSPEPKINYLTALYCRPDVEVPAGSRITVTDGHGNVKEYKRASEAFNSYATHQEIIIVRTDTA